MNSSEILGKLLHTVHLLHCLKLNPTLSGADDLFDVMDELSPIMSLYFPLGRALRLSPEELESIRTKYLDEPDPEQALNDVLLLWLHHQAYNVKRFGLPTWRKLVEAVNHPLGGRNYDVARRIALNHPASGKCWYIQVM